MNPNILLSTPFSDFSVNPNFTPPSTKNILDNDIATLNMSMASPHIVNESLISNELRIKNETYTGNEDKNEKILFSGMNQIPLQNSQPLIPSISQKDSALSHNALFMPKHNIKKGQFASQNLSYNKQNSSTDSNFNDNSNSNSLLFNNINVYSINIIVLCYN